MKRITAQHRAFADAYARLHRGEEAALEAGYGAKGARSRASELLKDADIQEMIRTRQRELAEALFVDRSYLLREAIDTYEQCKEGVPHLAWNPSTRQKEPDGTWNFDSRGAVAALKLVAELSGYAEPEAEKSGTEVNILMPPDLTAEALK